MENNTPLSRVEDILQSTIDNTEYDKPPQSRVESLLIELKEVIEGGGGGGSAYHPAGSVDYVSELPSPSADYLGYVYDITQAFTTTSDFKEGAGKRYPAGSNIAIVDVGTPESPSYKYDVLSGFIDTSNFVEKEEGKGLSTNDYTNADKTKLASLENYDDTEIRAEIDEKADDADLAAVAKSGSYNDLTDTPDIPNKTSDLTNDSHFVNETQMDTAIDSTDISSTTTGINPTITDSANGYMQDLTVYGESRTSKNLISSWEQGIINRDDGTTIDPNNYWTYTPNYIPISSIDYVVSMNTMSATRVFYYDENKTSLTYAQPFYNSREYVINTATKPVNAKYIRISFCIGGTTVAITPEDMPTYQVQLELGSTPTPYEPYFSGIHGIGEDGELKVEMCGKNLLNPALFEDNKYQNYSPDNHTISDNTITWITGKQKVIPNQTYKISFNGEPLNVYGVIYGTNERIIYNVSSVSAQEGDETICFNVLKDRIPYGGNLQLELGSTATAYEPYVSTSATVTTGIPLYAVGDVKDELDEKRGVIVKRCEKVVFDGSEEWTHASSPNERNSAIMSTVITRAITPHSNETQGHLISMLDNLSALGIFSELSDNSICIGNEVSYQNAFIRINGVFTATDLKTYLTSNPVTAVYELAEPYEIPLTSAELSALRGLKTYNPTTNVTITDAPTVDVGYLLNTENGQAVADAIDNAITGVLNTSY